MKVRAATTEPVISPGRLLIITAAAFGTLYFLDLRRILPTGVGVHWVSAIWMSLGIDFSRGILYRPLVSDIGLGGTRYFPLWFVVHGTLLRLGVSPVAAGYLICLTSAAALVIGAARLMGEVGVPRSIGWPLALLTLCSIAGVHAATTIRGDILPAALNMWGVVLALRLFANGRVRAMALPALLFVAAIVAKITAAYALLGIVVALALRGQFRRAIQLGGITTAGAVGILAAVNAISRGQMAESMRAVAFEGGSTLGSYLYAPWNILLLISRQDPMAIVTAAVFLAVIASVPLATLAEPLTCVAIASFVVISFIAVLPGIAFNHVLDINVFALLAIGYYVSRRAVSDVILVVISMAAILTMVRAYPDLIDQTTNSAYDRMAPVRRYLAEAGTRSIFAEDTVLAAVANQQVAIPDPYTFDVLRKSDPRYEDILRAQIREQRFEVVVLRSPVGTPAANERLKSAYGSGFAEAVAESYRLDASLPPYFVYRPASTAGGTP